MVKLEQSPMSALQEKLRNGSMLDCAAAGKSARQAAILWALARSPKSGHCSALSDVINPNLSSFGTIYLGVSEHKDDVLDFARKARPDFVVFGPEEPLAEGAVDWLREVNIPSVGPSRELSKIEASKVFARELIKKYVIDANPEYRVFESTEGLVDYMTELGEYVVKPDVLTGGKGVKVSGDHLKTIEEGAAYARQLLDNGTKVIIEEKLFGEEFSLQSFCDGYTLKHMPVVQDHKRAWERDRGPNTGGMGSYSCADFSLPFLSSKDVETAQQINCEIAAALLREKHEPYKGILYGSFIATSKGLKVIEYNARFGDPECLNVLSILKSDFVDICVGIIDGTLDRVPVVFTPKATVCKYVVPEGYPDAPRRNEEISIPEDLIETENLKIFYGAVNENSDGNLIMTGSRAIAFVGIGNSVEEAERIAEAAAACVGGRVFHRKDIGTSCSIAKRVRHMEELRHEQSRRDIRIAS